jgi:hypothetical protein
MNKAEGYRLQATGFSPPFPTAYSLKPQALSYRPRYTTFIVWKEITS